MRDNPGVLGCRWVMKENQAVAQQRRRHGRHSYRRAVTATGAVARGTGKRMGNSSLVTPRTASSSKET